MKQIDVREPGDPRRTRVHCVHLTNGMCMIEWSDGTFAVEAADTNVLLLGLDNWRDGSHLRFQTYDSPDVHSTPHKPGPNCTVLQG